MRVAPKSEKEIAEMGLWPAGVYGFEILEAEETTSKSGNDMIRLSVRLFDDHGNYTNVYDYLLEQMAAKLRHCAEVCGVLTDYENGELSAVSLIGKTGRCKLIVQKDKAGQYPDRNAIADYVRAKDTNGGSTVPPKARKADLDDEIPF